MKKLDRTVLVNKPKWLKASIPSGKNFNHLQKALKERNLATVCQEAKCPNISECWEARTATLMILGDTCTRACKFCHVKTGNPQGLIDSKEIDRSVEMVGMMKLRYVVITSVDRDDLPDHGADHFARVVEAISVHYPETMVEVLIPDFGGEAERMHRLAQSRPFVIAQNIETVKRLTHPVRDRRAGYEKTLNVLKFYKEHYPQIKTKSSLMVGLGESTEELISSMEDLRAVGVNIVTFGQYLQPSPKHLTVQRFYAPSEFVQLKKIALDLGFDFCASGPMVRSSYKASEYLDYLELQSS
jgi:lipoyl synthase